MEDIKDRIAECIRTSGLTKTAFGKKINLSQSFVSRLTSGEKVPSDRTIADICREFKVNEEWLRNGTGEMFRQSRRNDELTAFFGDVLNNEPDFRHRFISVLARMTPEEWKILESKITEMAREIKKDGQ